MSAKGVIDMNIEKWTTAMQEAMQKAMQQALDMSCQVVDVEDFLLALLEDTSGILYRVLSKAHVDIQQLTTFLRNKQQQKPRVGGIDESQMRISYDLNQLLIKAQKVMNDYKDEYTSVEHLIMAMFEVQSTFIQEIIRQYHLNKKELEKIIKEMRGGNMVNNPQPENQYEVLT